MVQDLQNIRVCCTCRRQVDCLESPCPPPTSEQRYTGAGSTRECCLICSPDVLCVRSAYEVNKIGYPGEMNLSLSMNDP